jgi:hypothetical protein
VQNRAILRNAARTSLALVSSEKHGAQHREKARKKHSLNYKFSCFLSAKLRAQNS